MSKIDLDKMSLDQLKILLVDEVLANEQTSKNIDVIKAVIQKRVYGVTDAEAGLQSPEETKVSSPQESK